MSLLEIRLTPTAQQDLADVRSYLDSKSAGLGEVFLKEFEQATSPLKLHPELFQPVRGDFRRGIIHRFRCVFIYTIHKDSVVIARLLYAGRNTEYF